MATKQRRLKYPKPVLVYVNEEMQARWLEAAEMDNRSMSSFIRTAVDAYIDHYVKPA